MITLSERQIHNFFPNRVNEEQVALATFAIVTIPSAIRAYCEHRLMASYRDDRHKESNERKPNSLLSLMDATNATDSSQDLESIAIEYGESRKQRNDSNLTPTTEQQVNLLA